MRFLQTPNLPDAPVRLCAVSALRPDIIAALRRRGVDCIAIPPHPDLPAPVASHPDGTVIRAFAAAHGVTCVELCDGSLCDVGSILPLAQGNASKRLTTFIRHGKLKIANFAKLVQV